MKYFWTCGRNNNRDKHIHIIKKKKSSFTEDSIVHTSLAGKREF